MTTLTDFLLARIAEDEEVARAASPGPWRADGEEVLAVDDIAVCDSFALSGPQTRATAEHIARHDPARVLAECEAKRRLVRYHESCAVVVDEQRRGVTRGASVDYWQGEAAGTEVALRLLATPYADHPDYREEWRP